MYSETCCRDHTWTSNHNWHQFAAERERVKRQADKKRRRTLLTASPTSSPWSRLTRSSTIDRPMKTSTTSHHRANINTPPQYLVICGLMLTYFTTYWSTENFHLGLQCFDAVGWESGKALTDEVLAWLSVRSEIQMICMLFSWYRCHPIVSCFIKIQSNLSGASLPRLSWNKKPVNDLSVLSSAHLSMCLNDLLVLADVNGWHTQHH